MKLYDILLEREIAEYHRYTPDEIKRLPEMTGSNLEGRFRIGGVVFDNKEGLGAVPWNQNVAYTGFVAMMKPKDFLNFSLPIDASDSERPQTIAQWIKSGIAMASPFLQLDIRDAIEGKGLMHITGHEGRGRCVALTSLQPNIDIPVHMILRGDRARHMTPEIVSMINTSITKEGTKAVTVPNKISSIWLDGKHIGL